MLTYAQRGDWGTWVCAIDAIRKGVCLRFLYGVLLDDPRGVLRAGSSVLKTWSFDFADVVDPAAVGAYVAEAVARNGEYKAIKTFPLVCPARSLGIHNSFWRPSSQYQFPPILNLPASFPSFFCPSIAEPKRNNPPVYFPEISLIKTTPKEVNLISFF